MTTRSAVINATEICVTTGVIVGGVIPVVSGAIAAIDRITCLIQKAMFNKALCAFIGERLDNARLTLKESANDIDEKVLERYLKVLREIEDDIKLISESKQKFKLWILTKKVVNAKEVEEKLIILYKKLDAANDELFFSVLKGTHQIVTKMKDEIPEQLRKLIRILTMKLDIDDLKISDWQINDVILDNKKISELRNQPKVIRGNISKKKFLTQDVAQKFLDSCDSNSCKIINMLKLLADCKNVIEFFGIYKLSGDQYLITEWCEHGNLEEYLLRNPGLDWNVKVNIATGIANGVVFCHDRDILHHDIRSSNIMLDAHLCPKLSNFELSRREQDNTVPGLQLADAARYLAPEKIKDKKNPYTKECDIFSLGIVLWVIAMQEKPYANIKSFQKIEDSVMEGNRPKPVDENIPIKYQNIMKKAWDNDSNYRPVASIMYEGLSKCLEDDDVYPVKDEPKDLTLNSDSDNIQLDEAGLYKKAVGYHQSQKREEAFRIFYELANVGHKESLFYLGYYYANGYIVSKDNKKALKYYRESADKDCSDAVYHYAEACLKLAHEYMEKAIKLGQFKAGIKLAEYNISQTCSQDKCHKLLGYLDADEVRLSKLKPKVAELYRERIERLRNEIKQMQNQLTK
ncbi:unnamed protein product [Rhizophagus irregularis]|uniref:Kinase-like protein n=1 Tax=Rhizophagus irregularis TaxID=588596 RepID=A0A2N1N9J2_9GLOM|nr:kinase-like protein [Rhizophagus irregularis]CAB4381897.1 unnamed protein product [Rhizophagus irregularis]CAB5352828.1 unnamed protein product [Rhizophagus irregularis]